MWSSPQKMKTWLGVDSGISSSSTAVVSDLEHRRRGRCTAWAEAEAAAGAVGFRLGARKILGREDAWGRRRNKSPMNRSHMSY
jgi:hypothetical protein